MSETSGEQLHLARTLQAPPERVFRLWTEPEQIKRWFGGFETEVPYVEVDLRVGGRYAIAVRGEEGDTVISGRFLTVQPPRRLSYTWHIGSEGEGARETIVTVTFAESDDGTEVTLTHSAFPDPQMRALHQAGWEACFDAIAQLG